ncbi:MAG: thioredoxin fold domain-containing protein [Balneolales bacterium]
MKSNSMHVFFTIFIASICTLLFGCSDENTPQDDKTEVVETVSSDVWYSIEEAQERAEAEDKKIVIAVYTEWCTICRRMDREVFANDNILETFTDYFYPVRLNAESDKKVEFNGELYTESELALAFGVYSYPTTVFVDEDGSPVGSQPGYIEKDLYKDILVFVGSNAYKSESFDNFKSKNL